MAYLKNLASRALAAARSYYQREPAKSNGYIATAVSAAIAAVGLTISAPGVLIVVGIVVPIILGAHKTRSQVTPV